MRGRQSAGMEKTNSHPAGQAEEVREAKYRGGSVHPHSGLAAATGGLSAGDA